MDAYNDVNEKRKNYQAERGSIAQSIAADKNRIRKADNTMQNLYKQYSDKQLMNILSKSTPLQQAGISPQDYINMMAGTEKITPTLTSTMSGLDRFRTNIQEKEALARFADNFREEKAGGGIANVAGVDKGPPPQSGPTPQGLRGLLKHAKNY